MFAIIISSLSFYAFDLILFISTFLNSSCISYIQLFACNDLYTVFGMLHAVCNLLHDAIHTTLLHPVHLHATEPSALGETNVLFFVFHSFSHSASSFHIFPIKFVWIMYNIIHTSYFVNTFFYFSEISSLTKIVITYNRFHNCSELRI